MKKTLLALSSCILGAAALNAQITVDRSDFGDVDTTIIQILDESPQWDASVKATGTAQTWDFTKFRGQKLDTIEFNSVASHSKGNRFSDADMVMENRRFDLFLNANSDSVYAIGLNTTGDQIGIPGSSVEVAVRLDKPQKRLQFPLSMGQNYVSVAEGDTLVKPSDFNYPVGDSARIEVTLTTYSTAEASGDITIFSGTFPALKVKTVEISNYRVYLKLPFVGWQNQPTIDEVDTAEVHSFYAKNKSYALAEVSVDPQGANEILYVQYQLDGGFIAHQSVSDESCYSSCDGSATMAPIGGSGSYNYAWSNGITSTTKTAGSLCEGTYHVTITDANTNKTFMDSVQINGADSLDITLVTNVDETLGNDGELEVAGSGGTGNFIYEWSNSETTPHIQGLAAGEYTVTITDGNGCKKSATYTVNGGVSVKEFSASNISFFPNPANENIVINGINGTVSYRIVSLLGEVVQVGEINTANSNVSVGNLENGMYLLEISNGSEQYINRLYIEK